MANGEQFENPANHKVDNLKSEETGNKLLADAQIAQPKAVEKAPNAPDAPASQTDKLDQVAGNDKSADKGDKTLSKLEQSVTANLADSAQEKIKSLKNSPDGEKLLYKDVDSSGKTFFGQMKEYFPLAYDKAGLENFSKK